MWNGPEGPSLSIYLYPFVCFRSGSVALNQSSFSQIYACMFLSADGADVWERRGSSIQWTMLKFETPFWVFRTQILRLVLTPFVHQKNWLQKTEYKAAQPRDKQNMTDNTTIQLALMIIGFVFSSGPERRHRVEWHPEEERHSSSQGRA